MEAIWTCPDCGKSPTVMPCPDCSKIIPRAFDMLPKVQVGAQVGQEVRAALEDSGWRVETLKAVEIIKELQSPATPEAKPLTEKRQMTNETNEYDTTNYIRPEHVIPKVLKLEDANTAIIVSPGGTHSGTKKGENGGPDLPYEKLYVDVEFPSSRRYQYRMSQKQCEAISDQLGTDRRKWVGHQLAFLPQEKNGMAWCDATVIKNPRAATPAEA